jgi:hypothetical protein
VFELPKVSHKLGVMSDPKQRRIPHETWTLAHRLWAADMHVMYTISVDENDIILEIGASHSVLAETAQEMKIGLRLEISRGALTFHKDLIKFYASNHGGLNEWDVGKELWRVRGKGSHDNRCRLGLTRGAYESCLLKETRGGLTILIVAPCCLFALSSSGRRLRFMQGYLVEMNEDAMRLELIRHAQSWATHSHTAPCSTQGVCFAWRITNEMYRGAWK